MPRLNLCTNVETENAFPDALSISRFTCHDVHAPGLRRILCLAMAFRKADVALIYNPDAVHAFASLLARLSGRRPLVLFWDTNGPPPQSAMDWLKVWIKRYLYRYVDMFLVMHRDISCFATIYCIPQDKFHYIPFKSNNFEILDTIDTSDQGYIFSGGASYRDFHCLIEAVRDINFPVRIVLPPAQLAAFHGTAELTSRLPDNVTVIRHDGENDIWDSMIANATLIVIPIRYDCMQPAGISVYLEAMALGKPVVISRGLSTHGMLNETMACLYEPGVPLDLREKLQVLLADPGLCKRLGNNGREYALGLQGRSRLSKDLLGFALSFARSRNG